MKLFFLFNCLDKNKGQTSRHPIPLSSLHLRSGRKCEEESPTRLPSTSFPWETQGSLQKMDVSSEGTVLLDRLNG